MHETFVPLDFFASSLPLSPLSYAAAGLAVGFALRRVCHDLDPQHAVREIAGVEGELEVVVTADRGEVSIHDRVVVE